jgi:phenylpropionate dioxygenase-like ring-hydroxylating dioxygenase large terminal subunit
VPSAWTASSESAWAEPTRTRSSRLVLPLVLHVWLKPSAYMQFSYPCSQSRIDHGELIRWTKGFGAPNIEGRDVAAMFSDSLKRLVSGAIE